MKIFLRWRMVLTAVLFLLVAAACSPSPALLPAAHRLRLRGQAGCLQPGAVPCAWQSAALNSRRVSLLVQLGEDLAASLAYPQAAGAFSRAANSPLDGAGWFSVGRFFWSQGRLEDAASAFASVPPYTLTQQESEALLEWQLRAGDPPGARRTLRLFQRLTAAGETACLAGYISVFDDPQSSLAEFKLASPGAPCARSLSAWQATLLELPTLSDEAYRWARLGLLFAGDGRWRLAAAAFERSLQANPAYADAWAYLGEARAQLGEPAWPLLQRAFELSPDSRVVRLALSAHFRRGGQPLRALEILLPLADSDPGAIDLLTELSAAAAEAGDVNQAINLLRRAVQLHPDDPRVFLAAALFSARYEVEIDTLGLPAARRALELDPDNPEVLEISGWLEWLGGSLELAEAQLTRAYDLNPASPSLNLRLGQLYISLDRLESARVFLRNAFRLAPQDSAGQTAARLLLRYFPACPYCP